MIYNLISLPHLFPVHDFPEGLEVRGAAVLVVEVVGVFPDVEGEERGEAVGGGGVGAGVLADGESAGGIGLEPDPAGAEEGGAFRFEVGLEVFEGAPLLPDAGRQGGFRDGTGGLRGTELREVQVVVQDLAGVVEDGAGGLPDDLLERLVLQARAGQELVQVVHIGLQVLAVVECQRAGADDRFQGVRCVG